jgi:hypothetical protein
MGLLYLYFTLLSHPEEGNSFSCGQAVQEEQLDYLTVKVEGNIVFKTSVIVHETTRCNILEELTHK